MTLPSRSWSIEHWFFFKMQFYVLVSVLTKTIIVMVMELYIYVQKENLHRPLSKLHLDDLDLEIMVHWTLIFSQDAGLRPRFCFNKDYNSNGHATLYICSEKKSTQNHIKIRWPWPQGHGLINIYLLKCSFKSYFLFLQRLQ